MMNSAVIIKKYKTINYFSNTIKQLYKLRNIVNKNEYFNQILLTIPII